MEGTTIMKEETKSKIKGMLWIFFIVYIFAWGFSGCDITANAGEKHDLLKKNNGISNKDTTIKGWKFRANSHLKKHIKKGNFLYVYEVVYAEDGHPVRFVVTLTLPFSHKYDLVTNGLFVGLLVWSGR